MRKCNILGESHLAVNKLGAQSFVNSQRSNYFFKADNAFISKNLVKVIIFCLVLDQNIEQSNSQTNDGNSLEERYELLS